MLKQYCNLLLTFFTNHPKATVGQWQGHRHYCGCARDWAECDAHCHWALYLHHTKRELVTQRLERRVQKMSQNFKCRLVGLLGALVPHLKQKCSRVCKFSISSKSLSKQEVLLSKVRQTGNQITRWTVNRVQIMLLSTLNKGVRFPMNKRTERSAGLRRKRGKWEGSQDLTTVYSGWRC